MPPFFNISTNCCEVAPLANHKLLLDNWFAAMGPILYLKKLELWRQGHCAPIECKAKGTKGFQKKRTCYCRL